MIERKNNINMELSEKDKLKLLEAFKTNYDLNKSLESLGIKAAYGPEDHPEAQVTPLDSRFGEVKASEANLPNVMDQRERFENLLKLMKNK